MMDSTLSAPLPAAALPAIPAPQPTHHANDPAATAQSFEAVFVGQMVRIMMDTTPSEGAFSGGHGEEMFRGVLAEKMGDAIARRGGFGLAPAVLNQIIRLQGAGA
ncbi:Rod binding domain-containing protein [Sphingomonas melonis]|uniref:Rod binding domain-containing protein n=2 Tax=Sphingomonas melonis TaxID=152682 RepID=A0A7Y9FRH3_9SPHN|nr:Rod binding domain-containing protein [Sphingomonas melonis]